MNDVFKAGIPEQENTQILQKLFPQFQNVWRKSYEKLAVEDDNTGEMPLVRAVKVLNAVNRIKEVIWAGQRPPRGCKDFSQGVSRKSCGRSWKVYQKRQIAKWL